MTFQPTINYSIWLVLLTTFFEIAMDFWSYVHVTTTCMNIYVKCLIIPPYLEFSTFIKNIINIYNLIYNLSFNTFSNNYSPIKFNQFKYSPLIFFKSIQKYLKL